MENIDDKIEYLSEFMLPERFENLKRVLDSRTRYMTVCLEDIFYPHNASAVIRSCEAMGIQDLHAVEKRTRFSPSVDIVRGTDKWMNINKYRAGDEPVDTLIDKLKGEGYRIVATSPHVDGRTPETFDVSAGRFAIFLGTEKQGLSERVMSRADEFLQIPMAGFVESLNISVCAAILLYRLTTRLRESGVDWSLTDDEKRELLFRWMCESVKDTKNILKRRDELMAKL